MTSTDVTMLKTNPNTSTDVTMLKTNPNTNTTMNLSNHIIIIISSLFLQIWEQGWQWHALVEVRHEIQWSKEEKALGRWYHQYTGLSWDENMSSLHHHDRPMTPIIIIPYEFQFSWGRRFFGHKLIWERSASFSSQSPIWWAFWIPTSAFIFSSQSL